ncbi:hypothetical protein DPMN_124136 [Dreissena polymorpha]|uniref:Uncharacterized protein n=2 Tax=Dreissena polymorpha TaxID=45954 RepID=A0A9D4GV31_DREPO|nr:hypothetical protein DPMN_124136 [Dreissena polymorpha]
MSEFTQARWRTVVVAIPSWPLEKALFALVIWLAQDWKYVQIVTACVAAPFVVAAW